MLTLDTPASVTRPATRARSWRLAAGGTAVLAGAAVLTGAALPWVETFAGLIGVSGLRGANGRVLAVAGVAIAAAGAWHVVRGGQAARWLAGLLGFAALGFSAYLLIQLARTMSVLGGDSMVVARGGPGLWVVAAGAAAAFGTLFFPLSAPAASPSAPATRERPPAASVNGGGDATVAAAGSAATARMRRGLQVALGVVWLLDAALQYQPAMFGRGFVTNVLAPASMGNPALLAGPQAAVTRIIGHDVAVWNAVFATVQLALAAGLLWRRTARPALAATIVWALGVWVLAEGAGGVLSSMPSMADPLTGAPGAAVLYALLALLIWPARGEDTRDGDTRDGCGSVAAGSPLGLRGAQLGWLLLWGGLAALVLVQPAGEVARQSGLPPAIWAAAFAVTGAGILWPATVRPVLALAVIIAVFIWVRGEHFGALFSGSATDPSTGPLLVLLAASCWPRRPARGADRPRQPRTVKSK